MNEASKELCNQIIRRFPEAWPHLADQISNNPPDHNYIHDEDDNNPHDWFFYLHQWLKTISQPHFPPDVVHRLIQFQNWCQSQPEGKTAHDDIMTYYNIGFLKNLFDDDELSPLLPKLMNRKKLAAWQDYFTRR